MDIKVTTTKVEIDNESLNKGEYNIRECNFDLAEEFTGLVCKALFTVSKTKLTYEQSIVNGKCDIPYEATVNRGKVIVGVIGYEVEDEELVKRYSPEPDEFFVLDGSYIEDIENQSTPTPSELEQLEQRVSAIEIDAGQVEINTQDISDIKQEQTTQNNDILLRSLITETGSQIELSLNSTNFKMTATLKDKNGIVVNTSNEIDLPLESVVVNASYDSATKELVLTLQNGTTVRVSIADLVSGLQTEITSSNKLASDLVDDSTSTNKFVTASDKTQITTNKNNITSLSTNKEDKSNKVTSISSSSTDTQYPSAKAVYDNLVTKADKSSLVTGEGTEVTLQNIAELEFIQPPLPRGNSEQDGEPAPDNEVPITNVTGDVEVLVQNKNKFDYDYASDYSHTTVDSYRFVKIADVVKGQQYNINNLDVSNIENETGLYIYITYEPNYNGITNGNNLCSNSNKLSTANRVLNVPTTNSYYIGIYPSNINETTFNKILDKFKNAQLEQGSTASTYVAHEEQTFTFPLGTQRMYLGDYLADDGIHHVRKQVVLNGSDDGNWIKSNECFYIGLTNKTKSGYGYCNYFKNTAVGFSTSDTTYRGYFTNNKHETNTYFMPTDETITTVPLWKTWLQSNPITVEYELATEEITPYTTEQQQAYDEIKQAISYEEQTNISGVSDESNPLFEVQAVQYKEPDYWTIAYVNTQIGNAIGGAY